MALTKVAPEDLATIVTTLEMRARPRLSPLPTGPLRLVRWGKPSLEKYRALFRRVGAPWLWYSRLALNDAALESIIRADQVEVYAAIDHAGIEVGMLELDFRHPRESEISYFGLIPELTGQRLGRWLMAEALMRAWRPGIGRVWLHTCTLDHRSALGFYRASGFVPVARTMETFPDPRITGLLPASAAPHIPRLADIS